MPTVDFSLKDLNELVGKELTEEELPYLLEFAKAELEKQENDALTINFCDTNLPYLWGAEGCARLFKGLLGREKGVPGITVKKSFNSIIVDKGLLSIRPFVAAFSAKGKKVNELFLKQLIQFQEKLCDSFGLKRKKIAVGIYPSKDIVFPVHYKAVDPKSVKFIPLEFRTELDLAEILEVHPTGQKFAFILEGFKKYPLLVDDKNNILSFPPIINSQNFGKVSLDTKELFVEVTGTDFESVGLICTILAYTFADRHFEIEQIEIKYFDKNVLTPVLKKEKIKIKEEDVSSMLGISLGKLQIRKLLEKARYDVDNLTVIIPPYRADILHPVDIIEDIGIMYGYNNIPVTPLASHTIGDVAPIIEFIDKCREILTGFGFQEIMSAVLSNKNLLYDKMEIKDIGTVEIKEFMSASYSVVRTWILPILLDVLSKNKHHDYPQNIFEQGPASVRKKDEIKDYERFAVVSCGPDMDYTRIKQILEALFGVLGVEYSFEETEHNSFIPGRVAGVLVKNKTVAYIGEISPKVLQNFNLQMPAAGFELNLSGLFEIINK